jgi:hypothetical protein
VTCCSQWSARPLSLVPVVSSPFWTAVDSLFVNNESTLLTDSFDRVGSDPATALGTLETEKGDRYMSGFERTKLYLDDSFKATRDRAHNVVSEFGDMSMNQMVQEQDVQEDKQRPLGTRLSTESELGDEE